MTDRDRLARRLLDESNAVHRPGRGGLVATSWRSRTGRWALALLALATVWGIGQVTGPAPRDLRSVEVAR